MGRLILEQKQINGQLTSMQNITYDRCPYQAVDDFTHLWVGQAERLAWPRAAANAVSGQKPGPTLRPGAEDREKKSGSVDTGIAMLLTKRNHLASNGVRTNIENSPCLAVCTVVCLDYGRGRVPTPPQTSPGQRGPLFPAVLDGGFLPPGPFSEDEKYSRIKGRGRRWRLRPVTSARSAGSYGEFPVYQKWGQKHGDGISFGVTFPESLEIQRKSRGHAGDMHSFLLLWDYGSSVSSL